MKKILIIVLAIILTLSLSLTSVALAQYGWWVTESLPMTYYKGCGAGAHCPNGSYCDHGACGPASAVAVGWYYSGEYDELPDDDDVMYDDLYDYMDTYVCYTNPLDYGPGFVEMALHYGYDNFRYDYDYGVTADDENNDWLKLPDDYEDIVNAIDNGWPVVLEGCWENVNEISGDPAGGKDWPPGGFFCGHYIVVNGYSYYAGYGGGEIFTSNHRIICTDNWCESNNLVLDWGEIVDEIGDDLEVIIIKDDDPENDGYVETFEWGTDEESLNNWQESGGEVDWYASACGSKRRVEIDDDVETRPGSTGTKSALFYRSSYTPYAYYDLFQPSYIQFWVRKDNTAYAEFRNGNGSKYIRVRINSAEQLQWWDGAYHTVYTISPDAWYWIGLFPNWGAGTYSIYVCNANGQLLTYYHGAKMRSGGSDNGRLWFGSYSGSGTFWIDDIRDSLR